jgi:hypothetical protein
MHHEDQTNATIVLRDEPELGTLTTLFNFKGCSSGDKKAVKEAFADAAEIGASIATSPDGVYRISPYHYETAVWWGKYDDVNDRTPWSQIQSIVPQLVFTIISTDFELDNLKRMREVKYHWSIGDIVQRRGCLTILD